MAAVQDTSMKGTFFLNGFLVLFFLAAFYIISLLHSQREANHLHQVTQQQRVQLQSIIYSLEKTADVIFENLFDDNDTAKIMSLAGKATEREQEGLRLLLHEKFSEKYGDLQKYGIKILHFHLPQSVSFLRFHNPSRYGDSLRDVRHSIDMVNETKEPVHGFEEGRILHGFRNVYPIFYWDELVGTVEISFSFLAVRKLAVRLFPAVHTLMLHEDVVSRVVLEQEQKKYVSCRVSHVYLKNREVVDLIQQELDDLGIISLEELRSLNDDLRGLVRERLDRGEAFSLARSATKGRRVLTITFLPVKNVSEKNVGYFVSYREDPILEEYNKRYHQVQLAVFLLALSSLAVVFFSVRQIKRRKKYQALATVDGLTGLANRFHFDLVLEQAVRQGKRNNGIFSLAIFDIDNFKKVNDTYGHDGGDKTLIHIASTVRNSVREQDLVVRWGGEEFVVLLPETAVKDACIVMEKLRQEIKKARIQSGGQEIQVTVSFGVAQFRKDMQAYELVKEADQALYRAKASGKDCVIVAS